MLLQASSTAISAAWATRARTSSAMAVATRCCLQHVRSAAKLTRTMRSSAAHVDASSRPKSRANKDLRESNTQLPSYSLHAEPKKPVRRMLFAGNSRKLRAEREGPPPLGSSLRRDPVLYGACRMYRENLFKCVCNTRCFNQFRSEGQRGLDPRLACGESVSQHLNNLLLQLLELDSRPGHQRPDKR